MREIWLRADFDELLGKTLVSIMHDRDVIVFTTDTGERYKQSHVQWCCEFCEVEDICGDLSDLMGKPVLLAEESFSEEHPEGVEPPYENESFTWTFYKISTIKGSVTIRWYGCSNGFYSETATFTKAEKALAASEQGAES